jgi:glycosyltransferase involved in cell wall biosynthesis
VFRGIPRRRIRALAPVEGAARLTARAARALGLGAPSTYNSLFVGHDAAVACLPWPSGTDAVYGYEDAALWTFQRAARRGLQRIWDLPLPHWRTIARLWTEESRRWPGAMGARPPSEPEWKRRRKDTELSLAQVVSVASEYTRVSLEATDTRARVVVTPYGFPVDDFEPKASAPSGPFTVLVVGTHDLRKGTPYLLEAWRKAALADARLRLVGPMRLTPSFLAPYAGLFEHIPRMPKALLGAQYRAADVLAFPTLGDGFGLVIQEAMCCATPVMTTRCGGGPECVTDGVDGWLLPERSVDALVEALRDAARDRARAFAMGQRARARALRWTWLEAGDALVKAVAGGDDEPCDPSTRGANKRLDLDAKRVEP